MKNTLTTTTTTNCNSANPILNDFECATDSDYIFNIICLVLQSIFLIYQIYILYRTRVLYSQTKPKSEYQIYLIHLTGISISLCLIGIQIYILTSFCQKKNNYFSDDGNCIKNTEIYKMINNLQIGYMFLTFLYYLMILLVSRRWLIVIKQVQENKLFTIIAAVSQYLCMISYIIIFIVCISLLIYEYDGESFSYQRVMHLSITIITGIFIISLSIISFKFYKTINNIYTIEHKFKTRILWFLIPLNTIGFSKCAINILLGFVSSTTTVYNIYKPAPYLGIISNLTKILMYLFNTLFIILLFKPQQNKKMENILTFQEDEDFEETQEINHSKSLAKNLIHHNSEILNPNEVKVCQSNH